MNISHAKITLLLARELNGRVCLYPSGPRVGVTYAQLVNL